MNTMLFILITVSTFVAMEAVAWLAHKYVMHGFLWHLHEDHHTGKEGFFEKNDAFFLIFAIPGAGLSISGALADYNYQFFIGLGITLYGIAYFFVHDIFIHQRFKIFRNSKHPYFLAIRRAHKMHHKHRGKEEGECFGMLLVPFKYYKASKNQLFNQ